MASPETHAFGRKVLATVWPQVTGKQASLAELQIAGGHAHLESGYGKSSYKNKVTGASSGVINNWGAVQSGKPPCGPGGFEASDTRADGTPYTWCYKIYSTPEEGAAHMVTHLTVKRPTSWEFMKRGDIDGWAAAARAKDPITGIGGYFEQSAEGRAKGVELRIAEIAAALNEPIAAKRGGPVDGGGGFPGGGEDGDGWVVPVVATGCGALLVAAWAIWRRG